MPINWVVPKLWEWVVLGCLIFQPFSTAAYNPLDLPTSYPAASEHELHIEDVNRERVIPVRTPLSPTTACHHRPARETRITTASSSRCPQHFGRHSSVRTTLPAIG